MTAGALTILGARGSYPAPGRDTAAFGGNTTALALPLRRSILFFDAGTGLIRHGAAIAAGGIRDLHFLFTHFHLDHLMGLSPFAPLYAEGFRVTFHLAPDQTDDGPAAIRSVLSPPLWPVPFDELAARVRFEALPERFETEGIAVTRHPLLHPGGSLAFRIAGSRSAVLATDTEPGPDGADGGLIEFSRGADHLLHDAQYTPEEYPSHRGWGHSTWEDAASSAAAAGAGRLILMSHHPERSDEGMERIISLARERFPATEAAREGMEIPLF